MSGFQNIVLFGAGNVATHLGIAIQNTGRKIVQVYSRTDEAAMQLAEKLNSAYTSDLGKIKRDADLFIISVADDAVGDVAVKLDTLNGMVVHTSGSVAMEILSESSANYGVLYPLQTFSKSREADFSNIPLCVEASSGENLQKLKALAENLSGKVVEIDSDQRKILHLAAVFASNFPNFMYRAADDILKGSNLDFDLLRPLILETAKKIQQMNPVEAQTGPAMRGDERILSEQLELLAKYPEYRKIYEILSEGIGEKRV